MSFTIVYLQGAITAMSLVTKSRYIKWKYDICFNPYISSNYSKMVPHKQPGSRNPTKTLALDTPWMVATASSLSLTTASGSWHVWKGCKWLGVRRWLPGFSGLLRHSQLTCHDLAWKRYTRKNIVNRIPNSKVPPKSWDWVNDLCRHSTY